MCERDSQIFMPRCACASKVYGSVFVCLCVCVCVCICVCRPLQLLKDESSASKSFYRLLVMFTWILIRELCLVLLTWNAIAAFSEESVAKLVHRVLLLYLVVSSALER